MNAPKHHDLTPYFDRSKYQEIGCYLGEWEISVPVKDGLEWCIALSYLTTDVYSDEELQMRLELLTGNGENACNVNKSIKKFNPFLNKYSCFYDKSLKEVVKAFSDILNATLHESYFPKTLTYCEKLEKASDLLKCRICLLKFKCPEVSKALETYPKNYTTRNFQERLTLFKSAGKISSSRFSFGLKRELGFKLQKSALFTILRNAELDHARSRRLSNLINPEEIFITSLLKSKFKSVIPVLYRSPYIAGKLADAGFETDPRVIDSEGFSSLYYAMLTEDVNLLYVLYDYAANACWEAETYSYRNPGNDIVSNLDELECIMKKDLERSRDFELMGQKKEEISIISQEILLFNKFLKTITKNMRDIRSKINSSTLVAETIKRKEIILSILETYDTFFIVGECKPIEEFKTADESDPINESTEENKTIHEDINPLNNYKTFKNFYNNLDFTAALLFFDNIFLLKSRLPLKKLSQYSEIESALFLSVLSNKYFTSDVKKTDPIGGRYNPLRMNVNEDKLWLKCKNSNLYIIPLLERFELRKQIQNFAEILHQADVGLYNVLERLPESDIREILLSLPEIKDELLLARLKHYIKTALEIKVDDIQSVLVIERALQVIGESIKIEEKIPHSYRYLLFASLPSETGSLLRQLRNTLSNLEDHDYVLKYNTERNFLLFSNIQSEIGKINDFFQPVYNLQEIRIKDFIIERSQKLMEEARHKSRNEFHISPSFEYQLFESDLKLEKLKDQNIGNSIPFQEFIKQYEMLLKNLVQIAESNIEHPNFWNKGKKDNKIIIDDINAMLWPLEHLLNFIVEHFKFSGSEKLIEIIANKKGVTKDLLLLNVKKRIDDFINNSKKFINDLYLIESKMEIETVNIHKFKQFIKGIVYDYSNEDRKSIIADVPEVVKHQVSSKHKIQESLEKCCLLTEKERDVEFKNIILSNKKRKELQEVYETNYEMAIDIVKSARDPLEELEQIFAGNLIGKKEFESLCEMIPFSEENKRKLSVAISGKEKMIQGDTCLNIVDRIRHLKAIVIENNSDIRNLWDKAKNWKTKQFTTHKIVQLYMRDPKFQASLEMLLFDCMNITRRKRLGSLWIKTSNLFSGINLRNVLGHGSPILENLGELLDPEDLPSALVNEILHLMADEDAIVALHDLYHLTKENFDDIMKRDEQDEYKELRERIKGCIRWKEYSSLLNRNARDVSSTVCTNSVISRETQTE